MAKRKSAGRGGSNAGRRAAEAAAAAWGVPSRGAAQRPEADLARRLRQGSDTRRARHAETARRLRALQAPLFAPLAKDRAGVAAGVKDLRAVVAGRGFRKPAVPTFPGGVEAGVRSGSILTIRVPPYDAPFTWNHGTPADVAADANAGTFRFAIS